MAGMLGNRKVLLDKHLTSATFYLLITHTFEAHCRKLLPGALRPPTLPRMEGSAHPQMLPRAGKGRWP